MSRIHNDFHFEIRNSITNRQIDVTKERDSKIVNANDTAVNNGTVCGWSRKSSAASSQKSGMKKRCSKYTYKVFLPHFIKNNRLFGIKQKKLAIVTK
ncbi:hypothetical protein [Listeria grandensis]|uniref:hypothetical protein n=1 Tax=Listeria grandensis TaxID=1494963 RepID=UPI00164EB598|nr:hypothetical protein [Listeria grandensis]MBC6315158.1 hypothetical protein [Listeria grandensis]